MTYFGSLNSTHMHEIDPLKYFLVLSRTQINESRRASAYTAKLFFSLFFGSLKTCGRQGSGAVIAVDRVCKMAADDSIDLMLGSAGFMSAFTTPRFRLTDFRVMHDRSSGLGADL